MVFKKSLNKVNREATRCEVSLYLVVIIQYVTSTFFVLFVSVGIVVLVYSWSSVRAVMSSMDPLALQELLMQLSQGW